MFAVIYRGYVKPDREVEYQQQWRVVANYFISHRGALGSCLHQTEDRMWLAYSRWPDKKTRDASWPDSFEPFPIAIQEAIAAIKDCLDENNPLPEICMEVVDDLILRDFKP